MRAELEALAAKYREMIALRRDASEKHAKNEKDAARLKALAARFPGALRELDTRTMASLEERLAELETAVAGGTVPSWAPVVSRFHGWMRVALRLRVDGARELAGARAWAASYVPAEPGDPPRAALDDARLASLVRPREGRVSLAARDALEVDRVDLDAVLFGASGSPERERD